MRYYTALETILRDVSGVLQELLEGLFSRYFSGPFGVQGYFEGLL